MFIGLTLNFKITYPWICGCIVAMLYDEYYSLLYSYYLSVSYSYSIPRHYPYNAYNVLPSSL